MSRKRRLDPLLSSASVEWATPRALFEQLSLRYGPFDLDAAATSQNALCADFCTQEGLYLADAGELQPFAGGGLGVPWHTFASNVWVNPPYGRGVTGRWVEKAAEESAAGCKVTMLLPARTDVSWFHDYIYCRPGVDLVFLRGRVKFGGAANGAPFPSMVAAFGRRG